MLDDWQIEIGGYVVGGDSRWLLVSVDGLAGLPSLRTSDAPLLRRHGLHPGDDFLDGRSVILTLEGCADDEGQLTDDLRALVEATAPAGPEAPVRFRLPGVAEGGVRRIGARVRRRSLPVDLTFAYGVPTVTLELFATDPLIYGDDEQAVTFEAVAQAGGLTWPLAWPLSWGAAGTGPQTVVVGGAYPTQPVVEVAGPATFPRLEHVGQGRTLDYAGLVVAEGQTLTVDLAARVALLDGSPRYGLTPSSSWWTLDVGANVIRYEATAGAGRATVRWRDAWV